MPGSRLLPTEQRSPLPAAPTTSGWWRAQVLIRSWLNRHRQRWLAPLLVCVPPVGVAMVWAGATRPGYQRRWLTAAAGVWMIVLGLLVSLLSLPGASPADAGGAPPRAGGPAVSAPSPSATPTRAATAAAAAAAAKAAAVRGASDPGAGVGAASVVVSTVPAGDGQDDASGGSDGSPGSAPHTSSAPHTPSAPSATPEPTKPTPTPTPPGQPTPPRHPSTPPTVPTANPFTPCSVEGAHAISPNGFPLRCYRTPIGLYWLWGQ